jgi:hypothetical protein
MSQVSTPFLLANAHELVGKEIAVTDWLHLDQMQVVNSGSKCNI